MSDKQYKYGMEQFLTFPDNFERFKVTGESTTQRGKEKAGEKSQDKAKEKRNEKTKQKASRNKKSSGTSGGKDGQSRSDHKS
ncbi:MAG: hypothetical protein M1818_003250 [Claussenomyces sp. TS43310]|nr:MAG: hypothetical protein M1818_003250 [Claussenomyces sp. TS43310]